jgi:hypothetical protein
MEELVERPSPPSKQPFQPIWFTQALPSPAELEVAEHVAVSRDDAEWMQWLEGDIGGALNAYGHLRLNEIVHFLGRLDPESSRNDALHGSA